jgi:thiol:disulfide interchange protein DsbD
MKQTSTLVALAAATLVQAQAEPVRAGHATVEWLIATNGYTPGEPLVTGLRMTLDRGWHTYWINPGEGGMPMSVRFTLPDGWKAGEPQHPLPIRFQTGDLHDFGYEGTVVFPIILHPPAESQGDTEITAVFSWLTCDDTACVPGDATLTLHLVEDASATPAADTLDAAIATVPINAPDGWALSIAGGDGHFDLRLSTPPDIEATKLQVFPLTPNVIHPSAAFDFSPEKSWLAARVPKSPYAPENLTEVELVVHADALPRPIIVRWKDDS